MAQLSDNCLVCFQKMSNLIVVNDIQKVQNICSQYLHSAITNANFKQKKNEICLQLCEKCSTTAVELSNLSKQLEDLQEHIRDLSQMFLLGVLQRRGLSSITDNNENESRCRRKKLTRIDISELPDLDLPSVSETLEDVSRLYFQEQIVDSSSFASLNDTQQNEFEAIDPLSITDASGCVFEEKITIEDVNQEIVIEESVVNYQQVANISRSSNEFSIIQNGFINPETLGNTPQSSSSDGNGDKAQQTPILTPSTNRQENSEDSVIDTTRCLQKSSNRTLQPGVRGQNPVMAQVTRPMWYGEALMALKTESDFSTALPELDLNESNASQETQSKSEHYSKNVKNNRNRPQLRVKSGRYKPAPANTGNVSGVRVSTKCVDSGVELKTAPRKYPKRTTRTETRSDLRLDTHLPASGSQTLLNLEIPNKSCQASKIVERSGHRPQSSTKKRTSTLTSQSSNFVPCPICQKQIVRRKLTIHMRVHTGERPYQCALCPSKFSRGDGLRIHMRTHTGEKPFECEICAKGFVQSSDLRRHLRTHTGEKLFKCQKCSKGYTDHSGLHKHLKAEVCRTKSLKRRKAN